MRTGKYGGRFPQRYALFPAAAAAGCMILLSGCKTDSPAEQAAEVTEAAVGDTVALEGTGMSFEIREISEAEEVKPADPGGYFYYYEDVEGWHYQVVSGVLHNPEQEMLSPEDFGAGAKRGNSSYETKAVLENSTAATFMGEGEETVAESPGLYLIALVEDEKASPEEMTLYYNEGLAEKSEEEPWDHGIRIQMEKQ